MNKFKRFIGLALVVANMLGSYGVLLAEDFSGDSAPETNETTVSEPAETSVSATVPAAEDPEPNDGTESEEATVPEETTAPEETSAPVEQSEVPAEDGVIESKTENSAEQTSDGITTLSSSGKTYKITASYGPETGIPADAELVVSEIPSGDVYDEYMDKATTALGYDDVKYIRLFDICLMKDGAECEPNEGTSVSIRIVVNDSLTDNVNVVHMPDDSDAEVVDATYYSVSKGTQITFDADGFSTYAIVEGIEPVIPSAEYADSYDDLTDSKGFFMSLTRSNTTYYVKNSMNTTNSVLEETTSLVVNPATFGWYFEKVEGTTDQFRIYTKLNGVKKYIKNSSGNLLSLVAEGQGDIFEVSIVDGKFVFKILGQNKWLQHSGGGNGIRFYTDKNNAENSQFTLTYVSSLDIDDTYGLNNKTFGIMNYSNSISGEGLTSTASGSNALSSASLLARTNPIEHKKLVYLTKNKDISLWTFHALGGTQYKLSTLVNGIPKYLKIENGKLSLVDATDASVFVVEQGTGEYQDQYRFYVGNYELAYDSNKFVSARKSATATHYQYLVDASEITEDDFVIYSASKVSVSDTERVTDGQHVIVYTRVWDEQKKRYEFYAVDHDGSLIRCFESGDAIQWVGYKLNTLLWDFVEYHYEGTSDPNFYYELYNEYSEKYIAPQLDGQILSDDTIGINMDGRKKNRYFSTIVAWDDSDYAYAGVDADMDEMEIVACPYGQSHDFYFAIIQDVNPEGEDVLHEVDTVDNNTYGITMKIVDFTDKVGSGHNVQDSVLGDNTTWENHKYVPLQNILSTDLKSDGYPTAKANGNSLSQLFGNAQVVNHLFIDSTYRATGYFEYDSTQNFATLMKTQDGNFTVYQELGTMDTATKNTLQHGQFMPYNTIEEGVFSRLNPLNLYDAAGNILSDDNPRKNEQLHLVKNPDYYFGVELETSFVQTPDGLDDWDHDIIYEFEGDDDFWLYVDGELVIDLGGIHSALGGRVNFATGEVVVNGVETDLRQVFTNNYLTRNPGATQAQIDAFLADYFDEGKNTFKNYTPHTMRIFYMERGAGASNLHMRFNQSSIRPGSVLLGKELSGAVDKSESELASFPYQIYYKETEAGEEHLLTNTSSDRGVVYRGTETPVDYSASYEIGGITYDSVFFLKPGEQIDIGFPTDAEFYRIVECGVNRTVYSSVKVNGIDVSADAVDRGNGRSDYGIPYQRVRNRTSVEYDNEVDSTALRTLTFKKRVYDETGTQLITDDNSPFDFRLYLGAEYEDDAKLAYMYVYHIIDDDHNYYRWDRDTQAFVSIGKTDYQSLSDAEKAQVSFVTSMNGAISKIPANLTVEVRELVVGTKYIVEERKSEVPDGYSFMSYDVHENGKDNPATIEDSTDTVMSTIGVGNPHVYINNRKGYGLRVNKEWSDDAYMEQRDPAYFAIYLEDGTPAYIADTLCRLDYGQSTLYWYLPKLYGHDFDAYKIREVQITSGTPVVNEDGFVTNVADLTFTRIDQGGTVTINGTLKGADASSPYEYEVIYEQGVREDNIRVDKITNSHDGFTIKKQDMADGSWIAGAKFTLYDADGNYIGTFTSDADGVITVAFLRENVDYTLTEIKSPQGYVALSEPLVIRQTGGVVSVVSGSDYTLNADELIIKDKPYTLEVIKTDSTGNAIEGVKFDLHKVKTVNNVTTVDIRPMEGYTGLTTDANGIVPLIDNTLAPGSYQLREKWAPLEYSALPGYINFTVSNNGVITLGDHPSEVSLDSQDSADGKTHIYTMNIVNNTRGVPIIVSKKVSGNMGSRAREFDMTLELTRSGSPVSGSFAYIKSHNGTEVSRGTVEPGADHLIRFKLADGDTIVINNIPSGSAFTVTEDTAGYTAICYLDDVLYETSNASVSGTVPDNVYVRFENTLNAVIPTGLEASFNVSVSLITALSAGLVFNFLYRVKRKREEY